MAAEWEALLSDVASVLQILSVLYWAARGLYRLRSCKLESAKLEHRVSELEAALPAAAGLLAQAISNAIHLVDDYNNSSIVSIMLKGASMERDMSDTRRILGYLAAGIILDGGNVAAPLPAGEV